MPEPVATRRVPAWRAAAAVAVAVLAFVPAVPRLMTGATFTGSTPVTGNAIGPRTCTAAATWNSAVAGLGGITDWLRLGEASGTSAADVQGGSWTYSSTMTFNVPGALFCQAAPLGNAVDPASTTSRITSPAAGAYSTTLASYASGVTVLVWFKNSSTGEAGRLLGLGNVSTAGSTTSYTDRVLWVDATGTVRFATTGGTVLASGSTYQDGRWHLAAVAMTSTSATLYVDGTAVASSASPAYYAFGAVNVYWRVGYDATSGSGRKPATAPAAPFTGPVDEVVVARSNLAAATVASLWASGSAP